MDGIGRHETSSGKNCTPEWAEPAADGRFQALLSAAEWQALPLAVRRRFSAQLQPDATRHYRGQVRETYHTRLGLCLANLARLAGGPLPFTRGSTGPAAVVITGNAELGGQVWTRIYARPGTFPQVIHSAKRFMGPTGLEEYRSPWCGLGFIMPLELRVIDGALIFDSVAYAVEILGRRIALPRWLAPGRCRITHRDIGGGEFTFTLELNHPRFGLLCRQVATFAEVG